MFTQYIIKYYIIDVYLQQKTLADLWNGLQ